jgi:hypothetical protein
MIHCFAGFAQSPCSSVGISQTMQKFSPQSSVWAKPQSLKALLLRVFFHNFQAAAAIVLHPLRERLTAITTVSPHQLPRSWSRRLQQQLGSISLLNVGRMNTNPHQ